MDRKNKYLGVQNMIDFCSLRNILDAINCPVA